jgi:carbon monoxide dehydrogenase subunit G
MELREGLDLAHPAGVVWSRLDDVRTVVHCIPGAELTGQRDDGTLEGLIRFRFGPKTVGFRGTVRYDRDQARMSGDFDAQGSQAQGTSKAKALVRFTVSPVGTEASHVDVVTQVTMTGPLAQFAETGGIHVGRRILAEFRDNLVAALADAPAAGEPGPAATAPAAPVRGGGLVLRGVASSLGALLRRAVGAVLRRGRRPGARPS